MRHSLRFRALALVFLFNSTVFAALCGVLVRFQADFARRNEDSRSADLVATIQGSIAPEGKKVASILRWPYWSFFSDAVLVDQHLSEAYGSIRATGIDLNPVGVAERPPDFDRQGALRAIQTAMQGGAPVAALDGRAVPIRVRDGVWGGLWYRPKASQAADYGGLLAGVLPWFALSTLLLTAVTFFALRPLVLDPIAQLAEGARRLRAGDFGVRLDVSARKDELAELVRSFNVMASTVEGFNQRLSEEVRSATEKARLAEAAAMRERRLAAMGELAAGIAHEINNPLGGLQNAVEDLKRPDLPAARRTQYLELLSRGLARIGETVNRLRRFTPRESPLENIELRGVVQDSIELVQHRARRLGVELAFTPQASAAVVAGLRNELGQAVLNLLVNALDALEEGGTRDPRGPRVELGLDIENGGARLSVRDNGPGADRATLDRVGDLFFTTKEVGRGTGLGLALVHSTLKRHGGRVRVSSERGRFFQVELLFPDPADFAREQGR